MIPNLTVSGSFNRFAYVINNPLKFNDPSGHCYNYSTPEAKKKCDAYWQAYAIYAIKEIYHVIIDSTANYSTEAVNIISSALKSIETGVNKNSEGNGINWIHKNLGGTTITNSLWYDPVSWTGNAHVYGNTIYLPVGFEKMDWLSLDGTVETMVVHEFAHVWDNNSKNYRGDAAIFGGGYGDHLMSFINAEPKFALRFNGGIKYNENRWKLILEWSDRNENLDYGNNSTADYFANTFAGVINTNKDTPGLSGMWMAVLIDLTK